MFNLKEKLHRHLFLEFSYTLVSGDGFDIMNEGRYSLLEKHGILPNIEVYWNVLKEELYYMNPNKNNDYIINTNIFYDIEGNIFSGVYIKIHHNENNSDTVSVTGGYTPSTLNTLDDDGKLFLKMSFVIDCKKDNIIKGLKSLFMHEFTHAYEDYIRLKNKRKGIISVTNKDNYRNVIKDYQEGSVEEKIANICYFLNSIESKAYIPTLKGEIDLKIDKCSTSQEIYELICDTYTWKEINKCINDLNWLISINDFKEQNFILTKWYEVTNEKYSTYNALRRILKGVYFKRSKHMINQICKIAFDMFLEKGEKNTIPSKLNFKI